MQSPPEIYPVYILKRVAEEIQQECVRSVPQETLGRLLGKRFAWQNKRYTKIVDWVGGSLEQSHVHATFTKSGLRECECFLDERYGASPARPQEVGLFHSHPFGTDPHFSDVDYGTFLNFPYDEEGNVFLLLDPLTSIFKVFIVALKTSNDLSTKYLQQVPWICYSPRIQD